MVGIARIKIGCTVALLSALPWLLGGCASSSGSGPQKASGIEKSLDKAKADMGKAKDLVSETSAALNDILTDPQRDLKPQFKTFAGSLGKLHAVSQKMRDKATAIETQLDKYLESRREQVGTIQDVALRDTALNRIAQCNESFKRLSAVLTQAKDTLSPYVANLSDIQKFLSADLTPGGLKAISGLANTAARSQKGVQDQLDAVVAEFDRVAADLRAGQ